MHYDGDTRRIELDATGEELRVGELELPAGTFDLSLELVTQGGESEEVVGAYQVVLTRLDD